MKTSNKNYSTHQWIWGIMYILMILPFRNWFYFAEKVEKKYRVFFSLPFYKTLWTSWIFIPWMYSTFPWSDKKNLLSTCQICVYKGWRIADIKPWIKLWICFLFRNPKKSWFLQEHWCASPIYLCFINSPGK